MRTLGDARKALAPLGCAVEDRSEGGTGINWEIMPPEGKAFRDGGLLTGLPCFDAFDVCEMAALVVRGEIGIVDETEEE